MRNLSLYFCLLLCLTALELSAQIGDPARADSASLQEQFDEMLRVSNRFQEFKVVRQPFLEAFMRNVNDSISEYTTEINQLQATIATQANKIQEQTSSITERENSIASLENEKESINLLGVALDKDTYTTIMWSTIGVLFLGLLFALARMRYAAGNAREATAKAEKLSDELETSKRRRLEIEQSLRRQLQDEINRRNA